MITPAEGKAPQTRHRLISYTPALFMVLFLLIGLGLTLSNPNTYKRPQGKSVLNGEWTAAYEKQFNESLPFRQLAIDAWGVLTYTVFGEGREGVLIGSDGWLYTSEEFLAHPEGEKAFQTKVDLAVKASAQLAKEGTAFLVAVVPAKARIYPEHLGRYSYPSYNEALYQSFISALENEGVATVSLLAPLEKAKDKQMTFLKTDTHWTPFGAFIAADAIAKEVERLGLLHSFGEVEFVTELLGNVKHEGDLLSYLPLGSFQERLGPAFDTLEEKVTEQKEAGLGLFGAETIPVTLIGTSYSANQSWQFENALKERLGADVLNMADEGQGPVVPLEFYLASEELKDNPPELVIWEIPERFIGVVYE